DLVASQLRLIGAIAAGETPQASEAADALAAINRMLSGWSTEGLMIFAESEESPFTLTGGVSSLTMGTGGDIATRPQEILRAVIRSGGTDYPVQLIDLDEYTRISV